VRTHPPTGPAGRAREWWPAHLTGVPRALADLVLPQDCAGCAVPGAVLCPACRSRLARPRLAEPRRHPPGFPPTVAAGAYTGPVRPAVLAFKEHGRAELAGPLGAALALAVVVVLAGAGAPGPVRRPDRSPVVLVPVPSSAAALRSRGRDHVRELATVAVAELRAAGVTACTVPVLGRSGRTRDSAGLDAVQRRANLAGRFRALPRYAQLPAGTRLVLVDDVVTSGATLTEAARALAHPPGTPGGKRDTPVLAAVVAATPRRVARPGSRPPPGVFTVRG
jgi:predicted amidophosphoribosyltransferase